MSFKRLRGASVAPQMESEPREPEEAPSVFQVAEASPAAAHAQFCDSLTMTVAGDEDEGVAPWLAKADQEAEEVVDSLIGRWWKVANINGHPAWKLEMTEDLFHTV